MLHLRTVLFLAVNLVLTTAAQAQKKRDPLAPPEPEWAFRVVSMGGGTPTAWFLGIGAKQQEPSFGYLEGQFVVLELGATGTRLAYGRGETLEGPGAHWRVAVLRTYGDPWGTLPNRTYAGPELCISVAALTLGFAHYWKVDATRSGARTLPTLRFAFGL